MNIKKHHVKIIWATTAAIAITSVGATIKLNQKSAEFDAISQQNVAVQSHQTQNPTTSAQCNPKLWNYVYAGDPRKFSKPQDRLHIIQDCISITGTLVTAKMEKDGDWHLTLNLDSQYQSMLNAKNISGQHGYLVLEPVCEVKPITQKDTLQEGVCDNYTGHIFDKSMLGKRVQATGAYVTDQEHGWRELHPITSIVVK